jgi:hypothetical protein
VLVDSGINTGTERSYVHDYVRKLCEQKAGIIQRRNKMDIHAVGQGKVHTENIKGTRCCS